ncbi:MAG: 3-isopropylmalate dehydratase small subunit [Ewingella americana]|jgi:3-isopropylmalate/(R)-2-methylmalate dehydratase small subunit|uniref:3-isopropylmalate dehydratase small subunit n=1 Tax=Ewingella americana TaxID=41202 RepID=UPI00242BC57A|nr:3-isopropylmalate dehydratase small subunit [Ewingella americana]MCI1677019.1 3-isopropylmalate dehydratase small subunit [Ewingella americana]MCI1853391.1 3-isopropylmalate dehydratase small subunit [Ewingella americana]MCI1860368.1 3-isopropylmalate dehydratase small subunit [Ewingella americana]MCI2141387.1 3-isopropylmalate dehydratase small subunit [Ewingella americana]MCI2162902.1 3-isopropylmalate dehydratase small subunit [Ewingella americana]
MQAFNVLTAVAAPLTAANVDTDVIMPKQFLKGIDRNGLDKGVFFDLRFLTDGSPDPEFILNQPEWQSAKFLVVGPNFGCGSSREHAVWGLKQLGIRALIGTTFAGIFFDNCQRNGVLTVQLSPEQWSKVAEQIAQPQTNEITLDLPEQRISLRNGEQIDFNIDELSKLSLLNGLDAIGNTLRYSDDIRQFQQTHLQNNPWLA